jgi:N utilization substance protein B
MANRHLSRSIVLQTLFEWDFRSISKDDCLMVLNRNFKEFAPNSNDFPFMEKLLIGVIDKQIDLDLIIEKAAPEWPIDKINLIDRNILRLGLYELLFSDRSEVPAKVAINEAIELSKVFGSDTSSKFVNGVLGAVYKEIGEPGKDEVSKKVVDDPNKPVTTEYLAGAVVYSEFEGNIYVALVHDVFGRWTLSKGHIEIDKSKASDDEISKECIKVIKDELSLSVKIKEKLGTNEYSTYQPEKGKIKKNVTYFLAESPFEEIKLVNSGGLDDARWFKLTEILDLNFYNDILPLITKAVNLLIGK